MSDNLHWKDVPCHFTWGMDRTVKNVHERNFHFLSENEEIYSDDEDAIYMFLFLAYLEFITNNKVDQVTNGHLDKADRIIDKMEDECGKRAFQLVSLANRVWILSMSGEPQEVIDPITTKLLSCYRDHLSSENKEKETAYLQAIEAFALRRLLLKEGAEEKYLSAVRVIPDIAMWHFELGRVAGSKLMTGAKNISEVKIPHYRRALQLKPDYVRCRMKLVECYTREGKLEEARKEKDLLEKYDTSENPSAICIRASFYIRVEEYDRALEILHEAEGRLDHSDIQKKLAITYNLQAQSVIPSKRRPYLEKALSYVDKCLLKHPGSSGGIETKFEVLCRLKEPRVVVETFLQELSGKPPLPHSYLLYVFFKMIQIFAKVNESNLHPDLEILYYLYESMVDIALRGCLESDSTGTGQVVREKDQKTLEKAKATVDKCVNKNKEVDDRNRNGRFFEANERLLPFVNNSAYFK